jgi:hypothetical protein
MRRRRTLRAAGLLVAAALTLAACAQIPTSGAVERGADGSVAEPNSVFLIPVGPQPGSSPTQIVEDYLTAGAAGLSTTGLDFGTARLYLSGDAATTWSPLAEVLIIDGMKIDKVSDTEVTGQASVVGKVDQDGVYSETANGATETVTFSLIQDTAGQWRIKDAPQGLILTSRQFTDLFRRVSLYFLTPDESWLVPDPRYYPTVNLATSAVKGLLAGPAPWLRDAVATEVPSGVALSPESVTVLQGQAEVDLSPGPAVQSANRDLLVAQIQKTLLGQVPQVTSVVVRAGQAGPQLQGNAVRATIGSSDLTGGPEAIASDSTNGDHLVAIGAGGVTPVAGVGSLKGLDARTPARSEDGQVRAFLSGPNELALVPTGDQKPTSLFQLPNLPSLAAPSVDRFGWAWTAAIGGSTVYATNGRTPTTVNLAPKWLAGRHIAALRVSRDGTRVAIVSSGDDGAGVSIDVAGIARDDAGGPSQLSDQTLRVGAALTAASSLVWMDDTTLGVLSQSAGSASVAEVPLGDHSRPLPDVALGVSLAGGRGETNLLVGTSDGHLLRYSGVTWAPVPGIGGVRDPSYPG